ncbi:MAG: hypothetical protein R2698_00910 [Microthrixaceae bacterium]
MALGVVAAFGTYLLYSAVATWWTGATPVPRRHRPQHRTVQRRFVRWMGQAGLGDVRPSEFVGVSALLAVLGAGIGAALFGGVLPALGVAAFCATTPGASYRVRRANRLAAAHDAWPHMIEEIRVLTGAAGRSIPQALIEVGLRGPEELRGAFEAGQREWRLSTDFERTVATICDQLADPTADAACETLLVAHEVGGSDLDRRLGELAEDRRADNLGRKDARSKQAGVRFARRFVVAVPLGMALAGMSLGDGRAAYGTATGQILVAVGIGLVAVCWLWSGRMLRLPREQRVFA